MSRELGRPKIEETVSVKVAPLKEVDPAVAAEAAAVKERKRFAQAVIQALLRYGRPRAIYPTLAAVIRSKATSATSQSGPQDMDDDCCYFITWEDFTSEVGLNTENSADVETVKEAVVTLFNIGKEIIDGKDSELIDVKKESKVQRVLIIFIATENIKVRILCCVE